MKSTASAILLTILTVAGIIGVAVGGYQLYWHVAKSNVQHQYDVNTNGQQYQSGLIAHERDLVLGYDKAVDPAQKQALSDQFCQIFPTINPAPQDLVTASGRIC